MKNTDNPCYEKRGLIPSMDQGLDVSEFNKHKDPNQTDLIWDFTIHMAQWPFTYGIIFFSSPQKKAMS